MIEIENCPTVKMTPIEKLKSPESMTDLVRVLENTAVYRSHIMIRPIL